VHDCTADGAVIDMGLAPMSTEAADLSAASGDVATPLSADEPMTFIKAGAKPRKAKTR